MKTLTHLKNTAFTWGVALSGILLLASCGSYQYSGYHEEDGIYSSGETEVATSDNVQDDSQKSNYYQQYFNTKSQEIGQLSEEADIFTDIDNYTTTETLDDEGYVVIEDPSEESYGAWGNNGSDVVINIYDTYGFGWNRPLWWNAGWGWNGFAGGSWAWNYGWGWNGWGWNYGWNTWGFNYGWGWGPNYWAGGYWGGFNNGFCWYRPRYNNYYNASYNRGRRASYGRDSYAVANSSRATNSRRSSYSRTENARRTSNSYARRSSNIANSRSSMNNRRSVPRNSRSSNISNSRRSSNNMSTNRSRSINNRSRSINNSSRATNSNRSSNMSRSSGSSSRSSGSMSRGSSSRSSGSVSRGGGSRRGGGRN